MHNVEATADLIEAITGYIFKDKMLCAEAVQMASPRVAVVYQGAFRGVDNNKRLSILGDTVLAKVLCAAWFAARDEHGEYKMALSLTMAVLTSSDKPQTPARWTIIRNEILGNDGLAARGDALGVDQCIFVADGTYRKSPKMLATTLEAIVGAVFQDGGDDAVMRVIEHLGFLEHRFLTVTSQSSYLPP